MSNAVMSDWPSGVANTGWPSEPSAMLMPGRVQGWPAGTQRAANAAQRLLSQAVAWWDVEQYRDGARFLRNRGTGGELLDLRLGSSVVANSNDPLYLEPRDNGYVYLTGVGGNYLSVPDGAALDITGDIDLRVRVALDDWTPSSTNALLSKWITSGNQRSYSLRVATSGVLQFVWSSDGTLVTTISSTVAPSIGDGEALWVRAVLDADNGASGHDVKFYTSGDGSTWTQLGATVTTAGVASMYSGTGIVEVGVLTTNSSASSGKFFRAQVISDPLGTPATVLDIDCNDITSGSATSFTAVTNQTVTVNRSTSGRKSVAVPSRHKGGKPVMLLGTDDYLEVQDNWQHGLLNFAQGDSFTALVVMRRPSFSGDFGSPISKMSTQDSDVLGWQMRRSSGTGAGVNVYSGDGTNKATVTAGTSTAGTVETIGIIVDRRNMTMRGFLNSILSSTVSMSTVTSLWNSYPVRVGRSATGTAYYVDMELYGAAVFRRALSAAEIKTLSDYFTGRIA